jgi:hypothetical protein
MSPREVQEDREQAAREVALGRRVTQLRNGHLGSVTRRWINADILPIAALLREAAKAYLAGDNGEVATLLDTPVAELSGERQPLRALMEWCLRGSSPGRQAEEATFADDMVLAWMATAITRTANTHQNQKSTLPSVSAVLAQCGEALQETVLGQFITSIQGASAMQAIRERQPEAWKQKKSLNRICAQLVSQVKPALLQDQDRVAAGEASLLRVRGHKKVLSVTDRKGELRMISLKAPDVVAWEILSLCWQGDRDSATSPHRGQWLALSGMILACAQRVGGWFDIAAHKVARKGHTRTTKLLVLSDRAHEAIKRDADRWVTLGFNAEPMVIPPEDGDYLTVKHRKVTGQRAPLGLTTNPEETTPWLSGAGTLASTPWAVNVHALDTDSLQEQDASALMRIAAHRRMAAEPQFYLPVTMDFRGRIYYRPTWVTPQSGDLGKSLLMFPDADHLMEAQEYDDWNRSLAMHLAGLYSGPTKLDKAPLLERQAWFCTFMDGYFEAGQQELEAEYLEHVCEQADKPLTLAAHLKLMLNGKTDSIPIQLDGTCNGLQHLSALFRDEEGARHVNLCRSTLEDRPADIYQVVADTVSSSLNLTTAKTADLPEWAHRLFLAGVVINRKTTKGPVMVLPYGGTRDAVQQAVKAAVIDGLSSSPAYLNKTTPWHLATHDQYAAFKDRDLNDHPLFNADINQLAGLVWDSIAPAIPRAVAAMSALQAIGSWVGERGLSWRVGVGPVENRLWVTQAKSRAARKQVTMRGFHLPDTVRRLTLNAHSNEIDPKAHRTGIVANFIHSQDAAHLAASVALFREKGGGCVGAVHDCVMVRPSEAALMGRCLREAFVALYITGDPLHGQGPLNQPVRLHTDPETYEEFPSWYALAGAAGVTFPEWGSFDINEVLDSAWFFS